MADAPVVKIGAKSYSLPRASAGVFEDCEEEMQRFLALTGVPTGKSMGAIVTLLHRILLAAEPSLTREDVKAGLASPDVLGAVVALGWAFGFEKSSSGEDQGPAAST